MRILTLSIALALGLATCPEERRPDPRPYPHPAGAAGAPDGGAAGHKTGGAAGAPSAGAGGAGGANTGGQGGYDPGAGGAPPTPGAPLCHLAEAPGPDPHLEAARADLAQALVATGYGVPADVARLWVTLRETHSAKTTVALLPPTGADWTPTRLEQVRHKMTGGGYVSVAGVGPDGGFRSPCPGVEGRITGIGRDVPALPSRTRR